MAAPPPDGPDPSAPAPAATAEVPAAAAPGPPADPPPPPAPDRRLDATAPPPVGLPPDPASTGAPDRRAAAAAGSLPAQPTGERAGSAVAAASGAGPRTAAAWRRVAAGLRRAALFVGATRAGRATAVTAALVAAWIWLLPRGRHAARWLWRAHRARLDGLTRLGVTEVAVAAVVLSGVAVALVDLHVQAYRTLSPVDEYMHLDAVFKAPRPVPAGELLGEEAKRATSCRRIESPFRPPRCDAAELPARGYPARGFNTAYIHPPTYYRVAHWLADVIHGRWGTDDVDSARLAGAVFLAVGLVLLYLLSRRLGASPWAAGGAGLLVAAWPPVWYASAVVTPDASSLPVGAAVLYAAVAWGRSPAAVVVLPLAGWASVTFKLTNVLVVGVACGFLLVHALVRAGRWRQRAMRVAAAAGAVALVAVPAGLAAAGIGRATEQRALLPPSSLGPDYYVDRLRVDRVVAQWTHFLPPTRIAHIAPFLVDTPENAGMWGRLMALTGSLLLVGTVAAAAGAARNRAVFAVAVPTLLLTVLGGPLYALANFSATHGFFSVSVRYGYVLVPCWAVLLAASIRSRRLGLALLVPAAAVCTYGIWLAAASLP